MHLASLEQQRELMRYMNSLNEWLGHDVEDRQSELRGVTARMDQLRDDLNRLGMTRGLCKLYYLYFPHIANIYSNLLTFSPAARAWSRTWRFYSARWPWSWRPWCSRCSWRSWNLRSPGNCAARWFLCAAAASSSLIPSASTISSTISSYWGDTPCSSL
jgi:hypothetical protein